MKTVELVTHCYAVKYRHYAQALAYQYSSLVLDNPNNCKVQITICMTRDDRETNRVVSRFSGAVKTKRIYMELGELGRRSIGRNYAAKDTDAGFVWFADCDQAYREGVIDRLVEMQWPEGAVMVFPRHIKISNNHKLGDKATKLIGHDPRILDINPSEFVEKKYNRAIGGVQIVKGDFARLHGYLDGHKKHQKPRTDGKPFRDFRDDLAYRSFCNEHGEIKGVDLPGMYRIRHLETTH